MKTGSWATYKGLGRISISRSAPRRAPKGYRIYKPLAPGPWFRSVDRPEYEKRFAEQLAKLDAHQVLTDLKALAGDAEPVLMCWEEPPFTKENWCHRRLVAEWFEVTCGLVVPELTVSELVDAGAPPTSPKAEAQPRPKPRAANPKRNAASKRAIRYSQLPLFAVASAADTIPDGEHRSVKGSAGFYTICNHGGSLACDCPSFIFSRTQPRSCKHTKPLTAEQPPTAAKPPPGW